MPIILTILVCVLFVGLLWFLSSKGWGLKWYEILIAALGVAFFFFAIQNFVGAKAEFEDQAASLFLWIFMPIGIILIAVAGVLPFLRLKSK